MQNLGSFILAVNLGLIVVGCRKDTTDTQTKEIEGKDQIRKEAAMGTTLQWLGHASFKICHGDTVIYIDPWKLKDSPKDASLVLISHSHYDHYSQEDIAKVTSAGTTLIASADVVKKGKSGRAISPGQTIQLENVQIHGVAAYNPAKAFHPKGNNWLGFIIEVGSKRIYYAGDTDLTDEMKPLKEIDVALLPVGGTYTMDAAHAVEAVEHFKPKMAIPYHWGDIVGNQNDAEQFAKSVKCETKILNPGGTISLQ